MRGFIRPTLLIIATAAAAPAFAGPFTVSSPSAATQKKVKLQAELKDAPGKNTWVFPKLEFTLPVASGLNVAVKGHVRTIDRAGVPDRTGFGDIEVKAKWNFVKAGKSGFAMAIEPLLSLPTGDRRRGLGEGRAGIELPLIIGYKTGAWELGSEIGYEHIFGSGEHNGYVGVLAMRRVTPALRLGAELVVDDEAIDFDHLDTTANVGFKLRIGKAGELQGLAGHTLHTADRQPANKFKIAYEVKF